MKHLLYILIIISILCPAPFTVLAADIADNGICENDRPDCSESDPDTNLDSDADNEIGNSRNDDPAENSIVITSFDDSNIITNVLAAAVAADDIRSLEEYFSDKIFYVTAYDADGDPYEFRNSEWDISEIDISTPGLYGAYSYIEPDEGFVLDEGVYAPEIMYTVSVQTPGIPDINCAAYTTDGSSDAFFFPWVLSDEQKNTLDKFSVYLKPMDGNWKKLNTSVTTSDTGTESDDTSAVPDTTPQEAALFADGLALFSSALEYGEIYDMQVDYPGGHTYIVSFAYNGSILIVGYSEGSRDGSGDGTDLPDVIQPEPDSNGASGSHHHHGGSSNSGGSDSSDNSGSSNASSDTNTSYDTNDSEDTNDPDDVGVTAVADREGNSTDDPISYPSDSVSAADNHADNTAENDANAPSASSSLTLRFPALISHALTENDRASGRTSGQYFNTNASAASSPVEKDTKNGVTLSGSRLLALVRSGESLTVTKGDITAVLPASLINSLDITDSSEFSLTLTHPKKNIFTVKAALNGAPVNDIKGTVISLTPGSVAADQAYTITDEAGNTIARVECINGIISFNLDRSGTYTIEAEHNDTVSAGTSADSASRSGAVDNKAPLIVIAAIILLSAAFICILLYRRRHTK